MKRTNTSIKNCPKLKECESTAPYKITPVPFDLSCPVYEAVELKLRQWNYKSEEFMCDNQINYFGVRKLYAPDRSNGNGMVFLQVGCFRPTHTCNCTVSIGSRDEKTKIRDIEDIIKKAMKKLLKKSR